MLQGLTHARMADIRTLRELLLSIDSELNESVKWNAPSYGYGADHRLTMRLQPGDRVELVLHRGAKKRSDAFAFSDETALVRWLAPDRGIVEIQDAAVLSERGDDLRKLGRAWLAATRD